MSVLEVELGQRIAVDSTWVDDDGALRDPDWLRATLRGPLPTGGRGVVWRSVYGDPGSRVVRRSLGVYRVVLRLERVGAWRLVWQASFNGEPDEKLVSRIAVVADDG